MSDEGQTARTDPVDVAIIGGGVSGLYAAWRIRSAASASGLVPPSVTIFEMGERVGGRLLTWLPAGRQGGLRAELGGMRFFSQQELVWNLLPQLGFGSEEIIPFPVEGPNLRLLLRGVSTPLDTPNPTARYNVPASVQGKQPGTVLTEVIRDVLGTPENRAVIEKLLGGAPPTDREQWDEIKPYLTWRGQSLWDVGFWNLISDLRTPETYEYLSDAFGYYSLAGNWNAAEAMQSVLLDFTQNPSYMTLAPGYQALPDALALAATGEGCSIECQTRLESFDMRADGLITLRLAGPTGRRGLNARQLILAMPRRALELLAPSPAFDLQSDPALKELVQTVTPYPAFKLYLFYEQRWWERFGIQRGRSISDLPIRQTYYFAPDPVEGSSPPWGLLMASYDDAHAVDFWRGLIPPKEEWAAGRVELHESMVQLTRRAGLTAVAEFVPNPPPHLHKASDGMLRHARTQLALLHDVSETDIPDPIVGGFADWGFDPFGGGWNFWSTHVDVRDVMRRIRKPLSANVYVVGEAYSGAQGWVEGALTATEVMLEEYFRLPRPGWLPESYYLGW